MFPEDPLWSRPAHTSNALASWQSQRSSLSPPAWRSLRCSLPPKLTRRETLDPGCYGGLDDILLRLLLRIIEDLDKGKNGVNTPESLGQACLVAVVDHFPADLGGDTISPGLLDRGVSFLSCGWCADTGDSYLHVGSKWLFHVSLWLREHQ